MTAEQKREATVTARVALWGGTLTPIESDTGAKQWVLARWVLTRAFDSLDEVESFLGKVGA